MTMSNYGDLKVWQKAMGLVSSYQLTKPFPAFAGLFTTEFNVGNVGQIPDVCQSRPKPINRPLEVQRRDSSVSHEPTRPVVQSAIVPDASWGFLGLVETFDRPDGPQFLWEQAIDNTAPGNTVSLSISRTPLEIGFLDFRENLGITTVLRFDFV